MPTRPLLPGDFAMATEICARNGWGDMTAIFTFHMTHPACHPFVCEEDGAVVGTGVGTVRGDVGWIGQISVVPAWRNRGLGSAITHHVMDHLRGLGCRTLLLFATEMGKPIYEKLGFAVESEFVIWAGPGLAAVPVHEKLRAISERDLDWICRLDRQAMGEDRSAQLRAFGAGPAGAGCWAFGEEGFLITTPWGTQTMTAATAEAGRVLLDVARATKNLEPDGVRITLPSANRPGAAYVYSLGFRQVARIPRMMAGAPLRWDPDQVFGRMSGALD